MPDIDDNDVNGGIYTYIRLIKNEFLKEVEPDLKDRGIHNGERGNPKLMAEYLKTLH